MDVYQNKRDRQNKTSSDVQEGSITGEDPDLLHASFKVIYKADDL